MISSAKEERIKIAKNLLLAGVTDEIACDK